MNRTIQETDDALIDLGAIMDVTKGGHGVNLDGEGNIPNGGLSDD